MLFVNLVTVFIRMDHYLIYRMMNDNVGTKIVYYGTSDVVQGLVYAV